MNIFCLEWYVNACGMRVYAQLRNDCRIWLWLCCMCDVENDDFEGNEKVNWNLFDGDAYVFLYPAITSDTSLQVFTYFAAWQLMSHRETNVYRIVLMPSHAAQYCDYTVYDINTKCKNG